MTSPVYGDAVNLASRMESNAPLDSIMIPQDTKEIVEDYFIFEDLGDIEVKGKEKPISVFKVLKKNPKKVERWERNSKIIKRSTYVGRDKEINEILSLYNISKKEIGTIDEEYKPIIVGLKGNAGIGKSRLVKEFVEKIRTPLLSGYTKSYAQPAYTIWVTMLKEYFSIEDDNLKEIIKDKLDNSYNNLISYHNNNEETEKVLIDAKKVIGYLFGIKYDDIRLEKVEPRTLQTLINTSMRHTIEAIAHKVNIDLKAPLVIYFDDCQWMDESSIALLKIMLATLNVEEKRKKISNKNVLFLLTYRPEFKPFREFEFDSRFTEFILKPLTIDFSNDLIDSMLGDHTFTDLFIKKIVENSGGNPFYIEELVNYLVEHSKIIRNKDNKFWVLSDIAEDIKIPLSLNNIILSRIDNLKLELKIVLQRASVIGNHFLKNLLTEVSKKLESNSKEFENSFIELLDDNWIYQIDKNNKKTKINIIEKYLFKHILTSEVCYGSILRYNQKILHKVIAETTEELFKNNKEYFSFIANHYEKAGVIDKAIKYLEKAGDYAKQNYENEKGIELYDKLIALIEKNDLSLLSSIFIKKGTILRLIGKMDDAFRNYESSLKIAEELGDKSKIGKTIGNMGVIYENQGKYSKALKCYEKSLKIYEELKDKSGIAKSSGNIGVVYANQGNYSKAIEYHVKDLKISTELNDKIGIANAVGNMGVVYHSQGNYSKAMECYKKDFDISEELGDTKGVTIAIGNIGVIYEREGKYTEALECYWKDLKISEKLGYKSGVATANGNIGNIYSDQGMILEALQCYEKKLKISEELNDDRGISTTIGNMGNLYKDQNKYSKAIECYDKALQIGYDLNLKAHIPIRLYTKACCLFKLKNYNKAKEVNERCFKTANDIRNELVILYSKILNEKINFNLNVNPKKKLKNIENLKNMLIDEKEEKNIAILNYELSILNYELNQNYSKFKKVAIEKYKKLFEKTPNIDYKNKFEELEKL